MWGFEQCHGIPFKEIFVLIVKWSTIRTLTTRAAKLGHEIYHMDIKTTFLNRLIKEEVYMQQPLGYAVLAFELLVCKQNRAQYSLWQSLRMSYKRIDAFFKSIGLSRSNYRARYGLWQSLRMWYKKIGRNSQLVDIHKYCKIVKNLIFLTITRPDIACAISSMSRYMSNPQRTYVNATNHIVEYIKKMVDYSIFYNGFLSKNQKVHWRILFHYVRGCYYMAKQKTINCLQVRVYNIIKWRIRRSLVETLTFSTR